MPVDRRHWGCLGSLRTEVMHRANPMTRQNCRQSLVSNACGNVTDDRPMWTGPSDNMSERLKDRHGAILASRRSDADSTIALTQQDASDPERTAFADDQNRAFVTAEEAARQGCGASVFLNLSRWRQKVDANECAR